MAVNPSIKPEIVNGATVVVVDGGDVEGLFIDLDKTLIGKVGTVIEVDRGYRIYQPEASVGFADGSVVVVELPNLEVTTAEPETPVRQARVKYMYSVEDNGVSVYTTFDREDAREEKAFLGGKAEGVIITAYAPVKEIR